VGYKGVSAVGLLARLFWLIDIWLSVNFLSICLSTSFPNICRLGGDAWGIRVLLHPSVKTQRIT